MTSPRSQWPRQEPTCPSSWVLGGLALGALAVNLTHLGTRSLAFDEATSVRYANLDLASLLPVIAGLDPNMSLYYVLLHVWVRLFGESEFAVRSLSACAAALAVPVVFVLGRRLFDRWAGVGAAILLALNPLVVQYAQTARSYALLVLLATLSSCCFVTALERPSVVRLGCYVVATVLALHAHYVAALVVVVHVGALLATRRREAFSREWWIVAASIAIACTPTMVSAARSGSDRIIGWVRAWLGTPSGADVIPLLLDFTGGSLALLAALLAGGGWAWMRAAGRHQAWSQAFVFAWLAVPIALCFVLSQRQPMFLSYYLIVCVPALVLFGAAPLAEVRHRAARGALFAVLVGLSATQFVKAMARVSSEDWRAATTSVIDASRPGDGVFFYPEGSRKPFEYYVRRLGAEGRAPSRGAGTPGRERVWLVIRDSDSAIHPDEVQALRASLASTHRVRERLMFRRITVERYERLH